MFHRLLASAVLLALLAGVCPPASAALAEEHGCCPAETSGCPSVGVMACCAPAPAAPAPQIPARGAVVGAQAASADAVLILALPIAPPPGALAAAAPCATHGVEPLPPLLHTCLWRI